MNKICNNENDDIFNPVAFEQEHDRFRNEAIQKFMDIPKMGNSVQIDTSLQILEAQIRKEYVIFTLKNNAKYQQEIPRLMEEMRLLQQQITQQHFQADEQQQNHARRQWITSFITGGLNLVSPIIGQYANHFFTMQKQRQTSSIQFWDSAYIRGLDLAVEAVAAIGGFAFLLFRNRYSKKTEFN